MAYDYTYIDDDGNCTLSSDGKEFEDVELTHRVRRWVIDKLPARMNCPYCQTLLVIAFFEKERQDPVFPGGEPLHVRSTSLAICTYCSYWNWCHNQFYNGFPTSVGWEAWISKVRSFDTVPPECLAELAIHLRQKQEHWFTIDATVFEKLVAGVFRVYYPDAEVIHVGRPGDGGVDVLFVNAGGLETLIQVKRRQSPKKSEGVQTVQNLLGVISVSDAVRGMVVSTADLFTYSAYRLTAKAEQKGIIIDLIDRGKLDAMIGKVLPQNPWLPAVKAHYPELVRPFKKQLSKVDQPMGTGTHRSPPNQDHLPF